MSEKNQNNTIVIVSIQLLRERIKVKWKPESPDCLLLTYVCVHSYGGY